MPNRFLMKVQKEFNGGKTDFSANGAAVTGHP